MYKVVINIEVKKIIKKPNIENTKFSLFFENVLAKVDVILTPVAPSVAFKLSDVKTPIELYLEDIFTISANLAGIPAISLPGGLLDNLPVGVQFMGKPFDEETLIKVADALEKKIGRLNLPKLD